MLNETVTDVALGYLAAGIVPIPVRCDGSKSPAIEKWKQYQVSAPTPWVVKRWFSQKAGIAIVCGSASHGLEVLDFDQWEVFGPWRSLIRPSLFTKLVVVETGGGGFHVYYRCRQITGNTKIASWEKYDCISHMLSGTRLGCNNEKIKETRIETRGEGGYVIAPGSPLSTHASGSPYTQTLGPPLPRINLITPEERTELWDTAAVFDCDERLSPKVEQAKRQLKAERFASQKRTRPDGDIRPGDDFDRRGNWDEILSPHGWTQCSELHWTRPGKKFGISASIGTNADGLEIQCFEAVIRT